GTTNTGAIDDMGEIARLCRERGIWLHVDGAYGAFAVLTERGRAALAGMELADSVTLDPHKWLAMPFEVGCLLVRDGAALERAFELHPEYLRERIDDRQAVNFADRGLQLTRASRAIKVWLAIQTFGVDAFRAPGDDPDRVDRQNEGIVADLAAGGDVLLTSTVIRGRYAIRLCVLNHTSGPADVEHALERVASVDVAGRADEPTVHHAERAAVQAGVAIDWLTAHDMSPADLRGIRLFAAVTDDQAGRFLATGREEPFAARAAVTERWALSRTFYIVSSGRLSVRVAEREVNTLGPGDHLGEIAAIDWGRDFSYGRTATVVATEASVLLAFPAAALRELML